MDIKHEIEKANKEAARRMMNAEPALVDIAPAGEVIPGMEDKMILHSGPPVDWQQVSCDQLRAHGTCLQRGRKTP